MDRKFLRAKVVQVLKDAKIKGIDQDVFSRRSIPTNVDTLPVALVYTKILNAERLDESPKSYYKSLDITIEVPATHDNDECLADLLDDISLDIEAALENSIDLEKCTQSVDLQNVIYDEQPEGGSPIASVKITFTITYFAEPRKDAFVYPDFKTAHTQYNINGNEDGEAVDDIDLPVT